MTFAPHPRMVLRVIMGFSLMNSQNVENSANAGAGKIVELHFDRDFSNLTPEEFLEKYIFNIKNLKTIFLAMTLLLAQIKVVAMTSLSN